MKKKIGLIAAIILVPAMAIALAGYTTVQFENILNSVINSTPIGQTTPAAATFTTMTSNGGSINNTTIGNSTPSTGVFTALTASSLNLPGGTGWVTLPNGWILEEVKGTTNVNGRGQLTVTLPHAFPHACFLANVTVEFSSTVSSDNWQGAAFYLQPNGCGTSSVALQYDVRSDGSADSSYHPDIIAIGD